MTKIDYSQLSDFEINKRVASKLKQITRILVPFVDNENKAVQVIKDGVWCWFNPCHNPEDAWPIIDENKISTMWMTAEKEWCAWTKGDLEEGTWDWENVPEHYFNCESQLRAAMIVFLEMQ